MKKSRNTWRDKVKRTFTSVLAVAKNRKGKCLSCGKCCRLPNICPFLKFKDNKSYCLIYPARPMNCRKYPRTENEHIFNESCGFRFE